MSSQIYTNVKTILKGDSYSGNSDSTKRYIAKNASFHIARIVSFLYRNSDDWSDIDQLKEQIDELKSEAIDFSDLTNKAFETLLSLVKDNGDLNTVLKSSALDDNITKKLHTEN